MLYGRIDLIESLENRLHVDDVQVRGVLDRHGIHTIRGRDHRLQVSVCSWELRSKSPVLSRKFCGGRDPAEITQKFCLHAEHGFPMLAAQGWIHTLRP